MAIRMLAQCRSCNGCNSLGTYTSPGACLCISGLIASGVLSLEVNPVPPVVMIRLTKASPSLHFVTVRWISRTLSGTILEATTSHWSPPLVMNVSWSAL